MNSDYFGLPKTSLPNRGKQLPHLFIANAVYDILNELHILPRFGEHDWRTPHR